MTGEITCHKTIFISVDNKNHWNRMSRDEMESALVIEYMKYAPGKTRPDEVEGTFRIEAITG